MSDIELEKLVEEQFNALKRGSQEIIEEKEFKNKIRKSIKENKALKIKFGIDPTGSDLHLGHALPLRKLKQFQEFGHEIYLLIGTFTARIGDPTGKSETRKMLSFEQIQENIKTYLEQVKVILDIDKIKVVYNHDWLEKLKLEEMLKLLSKFTVSQMISREDFSKRIKTNKPVSLIEFTYPILQAYDSVVLDADVELGATEQKFNLLRGRDLQRDFSQEAQTCFIMPILVGLDGVEKMSKSLNNYISIKDEPNDMFGKIMSISDSLMPNYFQNLTDLSDEKIEEILSNNHPMEAKKILAKEVVTYYYNQEIAQESRHWFEEIFSKRNLNVDLPEIKIEEKEINIVDLLLKLDFVSSKSEAKRLINQKAVKLNDEAILDFNDNILINDNTIIRCGKKKIIKIIN